MSALSETLVTCGSGRESIVYRGGAGAPLVYLHGPFGIHVGDRFARALAEQYELVAPLCPGFRELTELHSLPTVHDLAIHYDDLLESLGLDGIPVVGFSFGGMLAAELAAHFPRRASRLVLIAADGLWDARHGGADLFARLASDLPALLWADATSETAQRTPLMPGTDIDQAIRFSQGLTTVGKYIQPLPDRGLARRLYRIAAPTLVLWGAADRLLPAAYAHTFVDGIPNATSQLFAEAGHMLPYERIDEVVEAIARHCAPAGAPA